MSPVRRSARSRKNTLSPISIRKPKLGDLVDVFWEDRQVYFRGTLVKRWPRAPYGFYIRYQDGDYISTNLDFFAWHYADLQTSSTCDDCCRNKTDFLAGELEDLWGSAAYTAEKGTHSVSQLSRPHPEPSSLPHPTPHLPTPTHPAPMLVQDTVILPLANNHREAVSSSHQEEHEDEGTHPHAATPNPQQDAPMQDENHSAVATSQPPARLSDATFPSVPHKPVVTHSTRHDVHVHDPQCVTYLGHDSAANSCQSLTTSQGFCLLDNLPSPNPTLQTHTRDVAKPAEHRLKRKVSEARNSSDAHWKRRIRSRFLSEKD